MNARENPADQVARLASERAAKDGIPYAAAMSRVFSEQPDLYERYRESAASAGAQVAAAPSPQAAAEPPGPVAGMVLRMAAERAKADGLTAGEAQSRVFAEHPGLYERYREETTLGRSGDRLSGPVQAAEAAPTRDAAAAEVERLAREHMRATPGETLAEAIRAVLGENPLLLQLYLGRNTGATATKLGPAVPPKTPTVYQTGGPRGGLRQFSEPRCPVATAAATPAVPRRLSEIERLALLGRAATDPDLTQIQQQRIAAAVGTFA